MVEGHLVPLGVLPISGLTNCGDPMDARIDHAWLIMVSNAQGEIRVHSEEFRAVHVGWRTTTTTPAQPSAWLPRARRES